MEPISQDFEKLGVFYLGRQKEVSGMSGSGELLLYDSKDLTTHAVVLGMTGSGKTGLCLDLLEEAALDHIPAIVIDPKGDISNLLLTFPDLKPEDFLPWVDPGQAARQGQTLEEYAQSESERWKNGLASWGQTGDRIRALRNSVELRV
jgi:DNA helicase HerA-like ATPase